jgi:hypothetical protein
MKCCVHAAAAPADDVVAGPLFQVRWFRVILDEAQSIKNSRTLACRASGSLEVCYYTECPNLHKLSCPGALFGHTTLQSSCKHDAACLIEHEACRSSPPYAAAQLISKGLQGVNKTCMRMQATRRWCLSGTPVQNSIDDLYSYFRFLKYQPYSKLASFKSILVEPLLTQPAMGTKRLQAALQVVCLCCY